MFYHDDDQIFADINELDDEDHDMNMERIYKKLEKEITLKHNAMKLFNLNADNEMYMVDILNNAHFFFAIDYVECTMSFRQTSVAIFHTKDCLKVQKLGGINDHNVGQYVHVLVTTNLNKIVDLLLHPLV